MVALNIWLLNLKPPIKKQHPAQGNGFTDVLHYKHLALNLKTSDQETASHTCKRLHFGVHATASLCPTIPHFFPKMLMPAALGVYNEKYFQKYSLCTSRFGRFDAWQSRV